MAADLKNPGSERLIRENFCAEDTRLILGIPFRTSRSTKEKEDALIWYFERNGASSVRSGCKLAIMSQGEASTSSSTAVTMFWSRLWSLRLPEKSKLFAWRLAREWFQCNCNIWKVWFDRNKAIHEGKEWVCSLSDNWARKYVKDFDEVTNRNTCSIQRSRTIWTPPEEGLIKFNVDGATAETSGVGGICVVARNRSGEILKAKAALIKYPLKADHVEAVTIHIALIMAAESAVQKLMGESNAMLLVTDVLCKNQLNTKLGIVISDSAALSANFQICH